MKDLLQEYQDGILPLLLRIGQLNQEIARCRKGSQRDKLVHRRLGLWQMVTDMQQTVHALLDRDWRPEPSPHPDFASPAPAIGESEPGCSVPLPSRMGGGQ